MFTRAVALSDKESIKVIMGAAFGGSPWFENLNDNELEQRWNSFIERSGFAGLALIDRDELVAAIWWDTPTITDFAVERGQNIVDWVSLHGFDQFVWIRDLVVLPDYQGRGLASFLRNELMSTLCSNTLVLTRHRSDNHGIIAVSKKQGFEPVGIKIPSNSKPGAFHEYWYKIV